MTVFNRLFSLKVPFLSSSLSRTLCTSFAGVLSSSVGEMAGESPPPLGSSACAGGVCGGICESGSGCVPHGGDVRVFSKILDFSGDCSLSNSRSAADPYGTCTHNGSCWGTISSSLHSANTSSSVRVSSSSASSPRLVVFWGSVLQRSESLSRICESMGSWVSIVSTTEPTEAAGATSSFFSSWLWAGWQVNNGH